MKITRIVELIYTTEKRGSGTNDDPVREVKQLFTKTGFLVAELDTPSGTNCGMTVRDDGMDELLNN